MTRLKADDLQSYLFDGQAHPLSAKMLMWLRTSRRFATFISDARSKVRKKLRTAQDPESIADVSLELETAYLLLQERAFSLEYEPRVSGQPRTPDFAVSYTTHSTFMLEVTRLRSNQPARIAETVGLKLGQFVPERSNVLLIGAPSPLPTPDAVQAGMLELQRHIEQGDEALLKRFGLRDKGGFFRHYQRLSEVIVCASPSANDSALSLWVNSQARYPLSSKTRTALQRAQRRHS